MRDLFNRLWGISEDAWDMIRLNILNIVIYAFIASLIAIGINFAGAKIVNVFLGILTFFAAYFFGTHPRVFETMVAVKASGYLTPLEIDDLLKKYGKFVHDVCLYAGFFFLVTGTIDFDRNFFSVFVIYLALGVLILFGIKTRVPKTLAYLFTTVILVWSIGSLISGSTYKRVFNWDPYSWNRITKADKLVFEADQLIEANREAKRAEILEKIYKKIKKGEELSAEELSTLERERRNTEQKSIPERVSKKTERSPLPEKSWKRTFLQEYEGNGEEYLRTAVFGKDILPGDKIIVRAESSFQVYDNGWKQVDRNYSAINKTTETNKFLGIKLQEKEKATVEILRLS